MPVKMSTMGQRLLLDYRAPRLQATPRLPRSAQASINDATARRPRCQTVNTTSVAVRSVPVGFVHRLGRYWLLTDRPSETAGRLCTSCECAPGRCLAGVTTATPLRNSSSSSSSGSSGGGGGSGPAKSTYNGSMIRGTIKFGKTWILDDWNN